MLDVMAVFLYFRQTINRMIDVKIITISNSAIEASKKYIVVFNCSAWLIELSDGARDGVVAVKVVIDDDCWLVIVVVEEMVL